MPSGLDWGFSVTIIKRSEYFNRCQLEALPLVSGVVTLAAFPWVSTEHSGALSYLLSYVQVEAFDPTYARYCIAAKIGGNERVGSFFHALTFAATLRFT
jgi:hypothetical protein